MASNALVQCPLLPFRLLVRFGAWAVAVVIFVDLSFSVGPPVFYALYAVVDSILSVYFHNQIEISAANKRAITLAAFTKEVLWARDVHSTDDLL